jgi:nucleotide-binding universal stress UspA family protein
MSILRKRFLIEPAKGAQSVNDNVNPATATLRRPPGELRIVVGVEGSPSSLRALEYAGNQAELTGSMLQVVTVYNGLPGYGITTGLDKKDAESIVRDAIDATQKMHPTVLTKGEIVYGVAGPVLSDISEGASTLVIGTRGSAQVVGTVLGSISEYVVHYAHCTTTIVR